MTISNEAVEAAAKAIFAVRDDPYDLDEWDDIDSTEREPYNCHARAALEAAAPYLRAGALRDAADAIDRIGDGELDAGLTTAWLRARAAAEQGGDT